MPSAFLPGIRPASLVFLGLALSLGAGLRAEETEGGADVAALLRRAQAGDLVAQLEVTEHFLINATADLDSDPPRDFKQVEKWLQAAALKGSAPAARMLGVLLISDYPGIPVDIPRAFAAFQKAALGGDLEAMLEMGHLHMNGTGTPQDFAKSEEWLNKAFAAAPEGSPERDLASRVMARLADLREVAAENGALTAKAAAGDLEAKFELGDRLLDEAGDDEAKRAVALDHLRAAAESGHPRAQDALGAALESWDPATGFAWRQKAADAGLASAQSHVGLVLLRGTDGIPQDLARGLDYIMRAQAQGDKTASRMLSSDGFFPGLGSKAAARLAFSQNQADFAVLSAAAERGEVQANYWLGAYYYTLDTQRSTPLFEKAASQGHIGAMKSLATAYAYGLGTQKNQEQAFAWVSRAALLENHEVHLELAERYFKGEGTPKNPALARYWYERVMDPANANSAAKKLAGKQLAQLKAPAAAGSAIGEATLAAAVLARLPSTMPAAPAAVASAPATKPDPAPSATAPRKPDEHRAAAEKGDANAMYQLGLADLERRRIWSDKLNGVVPVDRLRDEMDFRWIMSAARAGHPEAQFLAATHWLSAESDTAKKDWLEKAAALGHAGAKQRLSAATPKPAPAVPVPTLEDLRKLAAQGDADAAFAALKLRVRQISEAIINKTAGTPPAQAYGHLDTEMSQWMGLLMRTVHVEGMALVCVWLETTQPAYAAQALYLRREIAALHPRLAFDSGQYYDALARRAGWEALQTRLRTRLGAGELANIEKKMADTFKTPATLDTIAHGFLKGARSYPKDEATAFRLYQTAANAGFAQAQFNLGYCYYNGLGVAADQAAGLAWVEKAAAQGHDPARIQLAILANEKSNADPLDLAHINPEVLRKALEGDRDMQQEIAFAWFEGKEIPQNFERAYHWFGRAAEQGLASARHNLGIMHSQGKGRPVDDTVAYGHYLQAAEMGLDVSQFNVGLSLWHGKGVRQDPLAAHDWIKRALDQGYEPAKEVYAKISADSGLQLLLAQRNEEQALQQVQQGVVAALGNQPAPAWDPIADNPILQQAALATKALQGDQAAATALKAQQQQDKAQREAINGTAAGEAAFKAYLAVWLKGDYEQGVRLLEQAATAGHVVAMLELSRYYFEDKKVKGDLAKGRAWLERAAATGDEEAQAEMKALQQEYAAPGSWELALGNEANDDDRFEESRRFWEQAAALGQTQAMMNLGHLNLGHPMFADEDVVRDVPQARAWYRKAAEAGSFSGMLEYGESLRDGWGGLPDLIQARQWFDRARSAATDQGSVARARQALESLEGKTPESAEILGNSAARAKNYVQAIEWWQKASELGSSNASFDLGNLYEKGEGVPVNLPEALRWYEKAAEQGHRGAAGTVAGLRAEMKLPPKSDAAEAKGGSISDAMLSFVAPPAPVPAAKPNPPPASSLTPAQRDLLQKADASNSTARDWLAFGLALCPPPQANPERRGLREAFPWFLRAAEAKQPIAMFLVVSAYTTGFPGTPPNEEQAAAWLEKFAATGIAPARLELARALESGLGGLKPDGVRARELYRKLAEEKNPDGIKEWARVQAEDAVNPKPAPAGETPASRLALAKNGDLDALARHYIAIEHMQDTQLDDRLKQAVQAGHLPCRVTDAQQWVMFLDEDAPRLQALTRLREVAAAGNQEARMLYADWLFEGVTSLVEDGKVILPADPAAAVALWREAARAGHAGAHDALGHAYVQGRGVTLDEAQARRHFRAAVALGMPAAREKVAQSALRERSLLRLKIIDAGRQANADENALDNALTAEANRYSAPD